MSNNYVKFGKNLVSSFWVITSTDKQDRHIRRNEKALGETQTLRAGCSKEPTIFAPPQTPFPGVRDGQNLISCRWSLPLSAKPVWRRSMNAISSYRGNRPTYTQTPTHPQASAQCNKTQCPLHYAAWLSSSSSCLYSCDAAGKQETRLSLTNRGTHLCNTQRRGWSPPLQKKTPLPMC